MNEYNLIIEILVYLGIIGSILFLFERGVQYWNNRLKTSLDYAFDEVIESAGKTIDGKNIIKSIKKNKNNDFEIVFYNDVKFITNDVDILSFTIHDVVRKYFKSKQEITVSLESELNNLGIKIEE